MIKRYLICLIMALGSSGVAFGVSLEDILEKAYKNSASLNARKAAFEAESLLITSKATLDDPMIGLSTLDRGNETKYGMISQKIRFPVKYYLQAKAQGSRTEVMRAQVMLEKYEVRMKIIFLYYSIFSAQKTIQLTEANMQAVREFSRIASRKYAAGKTSQGDSMKAHFELTQLELELIRMKQGEDALQDTLKAELNDQSICTNLKFGKDELGSAKL